MESRGLFCIITDKRVGLPALGRCSGSGPPRGPRSRVGRDMLGHAGASRAHARYAGVGRAARILGHAIDLGFPFSSKAINVY